LRTRSAVSAAETIRQLPEKLIFFSDDNLFSDPEKTNELLETLEPLRRRWACQISIDAASDPDLLRRMRRSGCRIVIVGFESLNTENLRQMNKGANLEADYITAIRNIQSAGLMIFGTFVIGYDADTPETALELAAFAKKHRFLIANFNPLIPTPGTGLYDRLEKENRLIYKNWWLDPDFRYGGILFRPKQMTPEQLAESCKQARYSFHSFFGILSRMRGVNLKSWFNFQIFILANIISRASIRQKQGRRLGE